MQSEECRTGNGGRGTVVSGTHRRRWVWFFGGVVLAFGSVSEGQYTRGQVTRPSDRLGTFRGRLGTRSLQEFQAQARGFRTNRTGDAGPLGVHSNYGTPGARYEAATTGGGPAVLTLGGGAGGGRAPGAVAGRWNSVVGNVFWSGPGLMGDVALLPGDIPGTRKVQEDPCERDMSACIDAGQAAFRVIMPKNLQRPRLDLMPKADSDASGAGTLAEVRATRDSVEYIDLEKGTRQSYRSGLYVARHLAEARNCVRQKRYEQALICYQGVSNLERESIEAASGRVYCLVMTGRFQAAGHSVLRLARIDNRFWERELDYGVVFGVGRDELVSRARETAAGLDKFITLYEHTNAAEGNIKRGALGHLVRLYLAWLEGDMEKAATAIEHAAKRSPYHPGVQDLYRQITGKELGTPAGLELLPPLP